MKRISEFRIKDTSIVGLDTHLLHLEAVNPAACPDCYPGQFVEISVSEDSTSPLLRRPFSVCGYDAPGHLTLLVKPIGVGSRRICQLQKNDILNLILPLGKGFSVPDSEGGKALLVGGGVGCAPLAFLAKELVKSHCDVTVAIGARSEADLANILDLFPENINIEISTDDGTAGVKGLVTNVPALKTPEQYNRLYTCGPTPMMKAIAHIAREKGIWCEVSLENHMACGLGACLCCVEKINETEGNVCVCTEGPVFNIDRLTSELWK